MHRKHRSRRQESPENDSECEYNKDQQRHWTTASKGSMKRMNLHQSLLKSDHLSRGSRPYPRSKERTSNCHHTPTYRTTSEEESSNDRRHHKVRTSGYPTKNVLSRTRVGRLQSPRVNSTRQDDRRNKTCHPKSPPRYRSEKFRRHSDSTSSSDNMHRPYNRAESKRCRPLDGDMTNTRRRIKMMKK